MIFSTSDLGKCLVAGIVGMCIGSGVTYLIMDHKRRKESEEKSYTYDEFMKDSKRGNKDGKVDIPVVEDDGSQPKQTDDLNAPMPKPGDSDYIRYGSEHPVDSDEDDGSEEIEEESDDISDADNPESPFFVNIEEIEEVRRRLGNELDEETIKYMIFKKKKVDYNPLLDDPDHTRGELDDVESEDGEDPIIIEPIEIDPNEPASYESKDSFWADTPGYEHREWVWYTKDDTVCTSNEYELVDNWLDYVPDDIHDHKKTRWLLIKDPKHAVKILIRSVDGDFNDYRMDLEEFE